ncbi:type II toxin-antitoxin system VapC family toxin [Duganella levis]|uniref:PIN domain-containing protein n=1 Tax=Duganella levis TaxID=2692169 RepID=A0ABW9VX62_9BURK|nr:type II toxin-antitoxin system VapC family toxin [Duganella levis]MYN26222.1 hypothetical protein [Duganella levis]
MIGLDTNVLARYYIDDHTDAEAKLQRPLAQRLIDSGRPLAVCKTVILELEWLMRNIYHLERAAILATLHHMVIDDRKFARRAAAVGLQPPVTVLR